MGVVPESIECPRCDCGKTSQLIEREAFASLPPPLDVHPVGEILRINVSGESKSEVYNGVVIDVVALSLIHI